MNHKLHAVPPKPVAAATSGIDLNGLVGTIFSSIGLAGWILILVKLPSLHASLGSIGDEQQHFLIFLGNALDCLVRAGMVLIGLLVFGFLSAVGTIVSALGLGHDRPRLARTGLGLGAAGLATGAGVMLWLLGFFS